MRGKLLEVVEKLSKKYNKKEILIFEMIKKCQTAGYNVDEAERIIDEFEKNSNCY